MKLPLIPKRAPKPSTLRQRLRPDQAESRRSVAQTFSYHAQRSDQTMNTGRKFRQEVLNPAAKNIGNFWLQRFGLGILLAVGLVCLVSALSLTPSIKLQPLDATTQNDDLFHNQAAYQKTADNILASSLFNRNKLTLNTAKLQTQLLAQYPELSSVTVAVPLLSHRPLVYVSYTKPALILHNQSGSFVLDTNGKVLAATTSAAINLGLPTVTDQSGLSLSLNKQVLTSGDVSFIETVVAGLKAKQVSWSSMTLPSAASELDVAIAGKPYYVKFNLHATAATLQIGTFLAVQQRLQGQNIIPGKYIDVRVSGRAYYL